MNIFELTFLISILTGSIMGGVAGKPFGVLGIILGIIGGILIGHACHYTVLILSAGLAKVGHSIGNPPKNWLLFIPWWIASFTSVMMMILSPLVTFYVLVWLRVLFKRWVGR